MSIYKPSGPAIQNIDFRLLNTNTGALASGTLFLTTIDLPLGFTVSTIYWFSGTTALTNGGGSPHYWVALFDSATRALLGQSTDNTAKAISASSVISDTLTTAYTTTAAGQYLVGVMVNSGGGTQPTFAYYAGISAAMGINSVGGQKFNGTSTTALGATAPNPAGAITQVGNLPWFGVA